MKQLQLLIITAFMVSDCFGQNNGFTSATNWNIANGGLLRGGNTYGYNGVGGAAFASDNTGSQSWALMDMDGDSRPDLVVTAQLQGGEVTCFSPGLNQYWHVFLNNGTNFSSTPIHWSLPNGGRITNSNIYGFDNLSGFASSSHNSGSQTWVLTDVNGDNKPDLVITAQLQAGEVTCFSPGNNQYWKVYLNTGTGFSSSVINWELPNGGKISGGITYGFNASASIASSSDNTGSQTWSLADMDGDTKPDLVVAAQLQGGNVTCFSPGPGQYWKVYKNTGTGFNTSPVNWNLPNGGKLSGGTTYGYNSMAGVAAPSDNTGSQTWALTDINGDAKPDLVITAQLQGGSVTCFSPGNNQYWKVFSNNGNGFEASAINWNLPSGGKISGGITYGFDNISGTASSGDNTGSQTWALVEMDGHSEPELVVFAQLQAGEVTCFSPGNNQYWKVYANTNNAFTTLPVTCNLPQGGKLSGGVTFGYDAMSGTAVPSDNTGSQSWTLMDMNGDHICDLVVTAQLQAGLVTSFSPSSEQYWKVYTSDFVTGIKEEGNSSSSSFNVFPNPNNGTFLIKGLIEEKITVFNELGQIVKTINLNQLNNFSAEINNLQSGVYFISGKNTQTKIIVIK